MHVLKTHTSCNSLWYNVVSIMLDNRPFSFISTDTDTKSLFTTHHTTHRTTHHTTTASTYYTTHCTTHHTTTASTYHTTTAAFKCNRYSLQLSANNCHAV